MEVTKKEIQAPLDPLEQPELDVSQLCDANDVNIYWKLIGELHWSVTIGIIDIMHAVVTMALFRPALRKGRFD